MENPIFKKSVYDLTEPELKLAFQFCLKAAENVGSLNDVMRDFVVGIVGSEINIENCSPASMENLTQEQIDGLPRFPVQVNAMEAGFIVGLIDNRLCEERKAARLEMLKNNFYSSLKRRFIDSKDDYIAKLL